MKDLEKADLLLDDIFIFDEDGDMEKSSIKERNNPFRWDYSANGDPEWTYMLNRFTYLDLLTRAFNKSNNKKYIYKGKNLIIDWINKVQLKPSSMTRTLDTGMRMYHFIKFYEDNYQLSADIKDILSSSIDEQILYLKNNYITKYDLSNWGLVQVIALSISYLFLGDEEKYNDSIIKLGLMLTIQYIDDKSIHWERSIGYHNFMSLWLLRLCVYQKKHGKELIYKDQIKKIITTTSITTDINGYQINNGDSDLIKTSYIIDLYEKIFEEKISPVNEYLYKNYGMYVKKQKDSMLSCYNFSMSSNHTHSDFTHFNYINKDIKVLDGGRYTYIESKARKEFKLFKHNNIVIDNQAAIGYVSSWQTDYYPIINPIYVYKNEDTFVEMSYYDYRRCIFVKRRIFYMENNDIIIFDFVKADGEHLANMNLLAKDLKINQIKSNRKFEVRDTYFSPEYNIKEECKEYTFEEKFKDTYTQCTIIGQAYNYEFVKIDRDGQSLNENIGLALKNTNNGKVIVNLFEEVVQSPRVFKVEKVKFHAQAAVLKGKNDIDIFR